MALKSRNSHQYHNIEMFEQFRKRMKYTNLEKSRKNLVGAVDENIYKSQQSIDDFCKIIRDFKHFKYSKHDSFLNLCLFSDITSIDIVILLERISLSKRVQEKKLFARMMSVVIVDYLDNVNVLIGRDCLAELKSNNMTDYIEEFKAINKRFSILKRENEQVLRIIRNNTIAHKSKNALVLNEYINELNVEDINDFGFKLINQLKELVDLSTKVIYYIVDNMKVGIKI